MKIQIKSLIRNLTFFIVIYMIIVNCICDTFKISSNIRYLSDIITMILLILMICMKKPEENKYFKKLFILIIVFFFSTFIGFAVNGRIFTFIISLGIEKYRKIFCDFFCIKY